MKQLSKSSCSLTPAEGNTMSKYDNWKTQTPEDEQDEREKREAFENARIERMIDELEDQDYE
jgi:hypothetical protein